MSRSTSKDIQIAVAKSIALKSLDILLLTTIDAATATFDYLSAQVLSDEALEPIGISRYEFFDVLVDLISVMRDRCSPMQKSTEKQPTFVQEKTLAKEATLVSEPTLVKEPPHADEPSPVPHRCPFVLKQSPKRSIVAEAIEKLEADAVVRYFLVKFC